jgi:hypothetical protein
MAPTRIGSHLRALARPEAPAAPRMRTKKDASFHSPEAIVSHQTSPSQNRLLRVAVRLEKPEHEIGGAVCAPRIVAILHRPLR